MARPALAGRRQRVIVAVLVSLAVAAVAVALVVGAGRREDTAKVPPGCVDGLVASAVGSARLHACGAAARELCAEGAAGRIALPESVVIGCRRNGYSHP